MRIRHILNVVGLLLMVVAAAMAAAGLLALGYGDGDAPGILLAGVVTLLSGTVTWWLTRFDDHITFREGYAIVTFAWTAVALAGALPYLFTGALSSPAQAVFESMSGFTTTGATVFTDIEALPHGILFWRSLTHWLGGMGIIVLIVAVLPYLGVGGMQLFRAEVPGPQTERLRPRLSQTAKLLWFVYLGLTASQTVLYVLGGMTLFDAVNHAFATLATGGFSTRNASIAAFDSRYIQYVTILFMYLAGVNFALHLRAATGRWAYMRDAEWRFFTLLIAVATLLLVGVQVVGAGPVGAAGVERAFRDSLFQTVSIVTTTGFISADYETWAPAGVAIIVTLMFSGGMVGSTGGGIKALRLLLMLEHVAIELKKHLHPKALFLARVGDKTVSEQVMANVIGFVILYVLIVAGGTVVNALLGMDTVTAFGAAAATVGNIGPGVGDIGATDNYGWMGSMQLAVLTAFMMIGRLEIYTVLLLFSPETWRRGRRGAR